MGTTLLKCLFCLVLCISFHSKYFLLTVWWSSCRAEAILLCHIYCSLTNTFYITHLKTYIAYSASAAWRGDQVVCYVTYISTAKAVLGVWRYTQLTRRDAILGSRDRDEILTIRKLQWGNTWLFFYLKFTKWKLNWNVLTNHLVMNHFSSTF